MEPHIQTNNLLAPTGSASPIQHTTELPGISSLTSGLKASDMNSGLKVNELDASSGIGQHSMQGDHISQHQSTTHVNIQQQQQQGEQQDQIVITPDMLQQLTTGTQQNQQQQVQHFQQLTTGAQQQQQQQQIQQHLQQSQLEQQQQQIQHLQQLTADAQQQSQQQYSAVNQMNMTTLAGTSELVQQPSITSQLDQVSILNTSCPVGSIQGMDQQMSTGQPSVETTSTLQSLPMSVVTSASPLAMGQSVMCYEQQGVTIYVPGRSLLGQSPPPAVTAVNPINQTGSGNSINTTSFYANSGGVVYNMGDTSQTGVNKGPESFLGGQHGSLTIGDITSAVEMGVASATESMEEQVLTLPNGQQIHVSVLPRDEVQKLSQRLSPPPKQELQSKQQQEQEVDQKSAPGTQKLQPPPNPNQQQKKSQQNLKEAPEVARQVSKKVAIDRDVKPSVSVQDELQNYGGQLVDFQDTFEHLWKLGSAKKETKIFESVTATISKQLQPLIPGSIDVHLKHLQETRDFQLDETDDKYTISTDLDSLVSIRRDLQRLVNGHDKGKNDRGVMCELLKPVTVTRSGRQVKPTTREDAIEFFDDFNSSDHDDSEDLVVKTPVRRRKTKTPLKITSAKKEPNPSVIIEHDGDMWEGDGTIDETKVIVSNSDIRDEDINQEGDVKPEDSSNDDDDEEGEEEEPDFSNDNTENKDPDDSCLSDAEEGTTQRRRSKRDAAKCEKNKEYEDTLPFKFWCKMCSFKTKRKAQFDKHMTCHKVYKKLYACTKCTFKTIRLSVLKKHEINTHSKECKSCPNAKCKYRTDNPVLLERHIKYKHKEHDEGKKKVNRFLCPTEDCGYSSHSIMQFKRHLSCHADIINGTDKIIMRYQCEKCAYSTKKKEHYLRHIKDVHTNQRPFLCDLCGTSFKRADALRQHRVIHMEKKSRIFRFKCSTCDKPFRSRAHLAEHMAMHTSIRSFLCEICGASFKTKSVQRKHVETIHKNPRAFECGQCPKRFNTKYALLRHQRTHDALNNQTQEVTQQVQQVIHSQATQLPPTVQSTQILIKPEDFHQTADGQTIVHITHEGTNTAVPVSVSNGTPVEVTLEGYEQNTFIPSNEATTALLYLTTNHFQTTLQ
ncbi:putative mediator of RNA polymerase II transcription subunit 26 [Lingula anatina]|uniref:Mediator of RNA polymerase II transcription subunit 26 n=1 Tax=Lingula anatina TaxID=7574 RepID=A0A1S3K2W7_LINAN|nr:putative mediator of RNA polymerase II transcription subunit 26 [Lingula anatina]|eukprot:XP_013416985.1 putative mediator of RNA polymerase II transcription subunit 26 [Lingula anatina]